jgi:hypothetical protein
MIIKNDTLDLLKNSLSKSDLLNRGLIGLLFSILILVTHHDLVWDVSMMLTIIGVLGIVKSVVSILYPDYVIKKINNMTARNYKLRLVFSTFLSFMLLYFAYK